MSEIQEAVRKLGKRVRDEQSVAKHFTLDECTPADYSKGFVDGVAALAGLLVETIPFDEEFRKEFLKDCGFDGEQVVG